ncbi:uncharacterized protein [Asterias amurensis]|uniref:uncharacterized protein n=1 Tax=Asterias amurensis TaxID=7602 RepID=UPI003AB6E8A6
MSSILMKTVRLVPLRVVSPYFRNITVRHLEVGPKGTYISKKIPTYVKLEGGKKYFWCKCGLSKKQPFCDGAHKPTEFKPVPIKLDKTKYVLLCQCKQTSNQPMCDMTHVSVMMASFGKKIGLVKK